VSVEKRTRCERWLQKSFNGRVSRQHRATCRATVGLRDIVAGTGGESHYSFRTPIANSEVRNSTTFGVLKLTLSAGTYTWEFVPVAGQTFTDSGSGSCH